MTLHSIKERILLGMFLSLCMLFIDPCQASHKKRDHNRTHHPKLYGQNRRHKRKSHNQTHDSLSPHPKLYDQNNSHAKLYDHKVSGQNRRRQNKPSPLHCIKACSVHQTKGRFQGHAHTLSGIQIHKTPTLRQNYGHPAPQVSLQRHPCPKPRYLCHPRPLSNRMHAPLIHKQHSALCPHTTNPKDTVRTFQAIHPETITTFPVPEPCIAPDRPPIHLNLYPHDHTVKAIVAHQDRPLDSP